MDSLVQEKDLCSKAPDYLLRGFQLDYQTTGLREDMLNEIVTTDESTQCIFIRKEVERVVSCCRGWSGSMCDELAVKNIHLKSNLVFRFHHRIRSEKLIFYLLAICEEACQHGGYCEFPGQCNCDGTFHCGSHCQLNFKDYG
ncbi:hypothetical protein HELRODRAFT_174079 [Helobdella robusta]|uniref:Uncharacterized protein n=1 Tax=Helobdella robusta TaxID=6412 RepID=T1F7K7_HELRO|nr:hypothetical protein HELRODRAFT_174079 [Helobdella robusta]ESO03181.1 hypothetical protein HELRODRAFT_174079 [Helobdella robusta]